MIAYKPEKVNRIVLKISGEVLAGKKKFGFDFDVFNRITDSIISLKKMGVSVGIVIGGGNFFRGAKNSNGNISRLSGDNIGMLATIQNSLAMGDVLKKKNYNCEIYSAIQLDKIAKNYTPNRAKTSLKEGKICFFCAGTGNPYFTTDTAAVLRGIELDADLVLKGTNVDGVFSEDPHKNPDAKLYMNLSYDEAINKKLRVMDMTAFSLARENNLQIKVFNINKKDAIQNAIFEIQSGTFVHS
ncbi:MAG: UMP kinase [Candidatus Cloacimonadota bacterium]|nr:UMP kinase [Candidatus Cloacimonadota bacterium]